MILILPTLVMIGHENGFSLTFAYFSLVMVGGFLLYLLKDSIGGASLGKRIVGLRVLREGTEGRSSFGRLLLRNLFMFLWPIELLLVVLSKRQLKLGDCFAGTAVYKKEIRYKKSRIAITVVAGILLFIAIVLPGVFIAIKHSASYETAITYIEGNSEVQQAAGGISGYGLVPSGGFEITNGVGSANYRITVKGVQHNVKVEVTLSYTSGEPWHVDSMRVVE